MRFLFSTHGAETPQATISTENFREPSNPPNQRNGSNEWKNSIKSVKTPKDQPNAMPRKNSGSRDYTTISRKNSKSTLASLPTYPINATSTRNSSTSSCENSSLPARPSSQSHKLRKLLEEFDPKVSNSPDIGHKESAREMFVGAILWAAARLQRHLWILRSGNDKYKELRTNERWEMISLDLERYTKAVQTYETWNSFTSQTSVSDSKNQPPKTNNWGRTLAILECAEHHFAKPNSKIDTATLDELSRSFVYPRTNWPQFNTCCSPCAPESSLLQRAKNSGIVPRMVMAVFSGCALIVPMAIMSSSTGSGSLLTTIVSTLVIGLIMACWAENAKSIEIVVASAAYATVLMVFGGQKSL